MAVTEASLKAAFPEFENTPTAIVDRSIATAERHCSEAIFGDLYDDAVGYLACHFITRDPRGEPVAHAMGGSGLPGVNVFKGEKVIRGTSKYRNAYESLRAIVVIPFTVA